MKQIMIVGAIRGGKHQQDQVVSPNGICKCLTSGSHLNAAWMTLIIDVYEANNVSEQQGEW